MPANPFDDADVREPWVPRPQPNRGIPKTLGILNIVFGSGLLLCGACAGLYAAILPSMGTMMKAQNQQLRATVIAEQQADLKKLQAQEQATEDEEEKAALQAKQKKLKAMAPPPLPDTTKMFDVPGLQAYMLTDSITGIVFNVLLVVSGIGLLGFKEWGRTLALWTAGLKIVRLVAIYGCWFPLVLAPVFVQRFKEMFGEMAAAPGGPPPAQMNQMLQTMGVVYSAYSIGFMLLGCIYPVLVAILLTRPRVKAAFVAEPPEWDRRGEPA
jgi:hypothetical protein